MNKMIVAVAFAVLFVFVRPTFADDDEIPFKFSITLQGDYRKGIKSPACAFAINTEIKNISSEDQKITVWSCGYGDTWLSDGGAVFITGVMSCTSNTAQEIILKKHESYKRILHVTIVKGTPLGELMFRLGFLPPKIDAPWTYKGYIQYPIVWSNTVKIHVEDWMQPLFVLEPKEKNLSESIR